MLMRAGRSVCDLPFGRYALRLGHGIAHLRVLQPGDPLLQLEDLVFDL
jgi:hypothetical protein